jgi:hypothetical protein
MKIKGYMYPQMNKPVGMLHAPFSRALSSETAMLEMDILAKILKFESS